MKKDKRILALVLAAVMMGTTALPVWAQTPETADSPGRSRKQRKRARCPA